MHAPTSLPNITICDPLMHAAKLSDMTVSDNDAFTLVGPGGYTQENGLEEGADLFEDIPPLFPYPTPKGPDGKEKPKNKWHTAHSHVRSGKYNRELRKVLVEEVRSERLTITEATHCARGFLAFQRSFLRRSTYPNETYWGVSGHV